MFPLALILLSFISELRSPVCKLTTSGVLPILPYSSRKLNLMREISAFL